MQDHLTLERGIRDAVGKALTFVLLWVPLNALAEEYFVDAVPGSSCPGTYDVATRSCGGGAHISFLTIQQAANEVEAGDTVTVRSGTFHENVTMKRSGSDASPITFRSYPGEQAVVDCSIGCSGQFAVHWKGGGQAHDFIIWDNIDVVGGALKYSIWLEGHNNVVENSEISYSNDGESLIGATCLEVMRSDGSVVRNNDVHHCGWNGISITDTNEAVVEGNVSHDNMHHNCLQFMSATSRPAVIWSDNIARHNLLHNCRHGVYVRYQERLTVTGNVMYRPTAAGVNFTRHPEDPMRIYQSNSTIANNTIVGGHPEAETWQDGIKTDSATYLTIKNNILVFNNSDDIEIEPQVSTGHDIDSNLHFDSFRCALAGNRYSSLAGWQSASPQVGSRSVYADPMFRDAAGHDYSLAEDSPAIDTGLDLGAAYAQALSPSSVWPESVILVGQGDYGAGWEIGAYAYGAGGAPGNAGGAPGNDGGAPGNAGGAPGNDGGAPVTEGGAPVTEGGAPVTEGGAPVTEGGAPVTEGGPLSADSGIKDGEGVEQAGASGQGGDNAAGNGSEMAETAGSDVAGSGGGRTIGGSAGAALPVASDLPASEGGAGMDDAQGPGSDSSGCGCRTTGSRPAPRPVVLLGLLSLGLALARRRGQGRAGGLGS